MRWLRWTMWTYPEWKAFFRQRANRCRVDEEWCGLFIGRRYCSTHGYRWDPGQKPCPGHARPVEDLSEGTWVR